MTYWLDLLQTELFGVLAWLSLGLLIGFVIGVVIIDWLTQKDKQKSKKPK